MPKTLEQQLLEANSIISSTKDELGQVKGEMTALENQLHDIDPKLSFDDIPATTAELKIEMESELADIENGLVEIQSAIREMQNPIETEGM